MIPFFSVSFEVCRETSYFLKVSRVYFSCSWFFLPFFKAKKTFRIASNFSSYRVTCHLVLVTIQRRIGYPKPGFWKCHEHANFCLFVIFDDFSKQSTRYAKVLRHCISLKIDSYNAHCLLKFFSVFILQSKKKFQPTVGIVEIIFQGDGVGCSC